MKDILKKYGLLLVFVVSACDLNGDLVNPNQISVEGADVNLIMNSIQLDFADFYNTASARTHRLVRMEAMTAGYRYQTANTAEGVNGMWSLAYKDILNNAGVIIELAEPKNLTTHVAVAKTLSAYVYLTLVDVFGDVPQSEALKAADGVFNPNVDGGSQVYDYAISLLQEARTELAKTGSDAGAALSRDIYYKGDRAKWTALVNTLELKAWVNIRMIASRTAEADTKITALLASDLIDTEAENFTYKYGTATVPVSRHPLYRRYYDPIKASASGYIGTFFLNEMFQGKGVEDPRWRYYFYRQVGSISKALSIDPKSLGCTPGAPPDHYVTSGSAFCVFEPGFYGRDHGDASGTPPDSPVITCAGVYPAGGKADTNPVSNVNFAKATIQGDGGNGAGIEPIWMSFYTDFLKAEILSRRGDNANAKIAMNAGINNSISQVKSFSTSIGQTVDAGLQPSTSAYLAVVNSNFDAAAKKLDIIGREFYVAAWGNGLEAYNNYRRTSAPRNMQPTLDLNPGAFYRSMVYPANFVNLNENADQKDINDPVKVFWDTNPDILN